MPKVNPWKEIRVLRTIDSYQLAYFYEGQNFTVPSLRNDMTRLKIPHQMVAGYVTVPKENYPLLRAFLDKLEKGGMVALTYVSSDILVNLKKPVYINF